MHDGIGHMVHPPGWRTPPGKSVITPDFELDEIDNDELVSACVEAEGAEENKVHNVEIVYRRTGCNRWENMCSRILM